MPTLNLLKIGVLTFIMFSAHIWGRIHDKNIDTEIFLEELKCRKKTEHPDPPRLPRNFSWRGRYIVPDLKVNVPFIWNGNDGDIQMIAGSEKDPIFFTNLIYHNHLYTYTYKWPCLQPEFLPPLERCCPLLKFSLDDLNALFATSFFVGAEILEKKTRHCCKRLHVNHFRLAIALPHFPPGFYPRLPFLSADIYVNQKDSSKIVKILHFGLQNLYDPNLDEWIVINQFDDCPGEVTLPPPCEVCTQSKRS